MEKTNRRDISWPNLIKVTANFMIANSLNDLEIEDKISSSEGTWGKLSQLFFDSPFNQNDAYYLRKNWQRDREGYKTTVLNILKFKPKQNLDLNFIDLFFDYSDWLDLMKSVSEDKKGRKYFTSDFSKSLSLKMQEAGVNCQVNCDYNYFPKKKAEIEWKGIYICKFCGMKFDVVCASLNFERVKIIVTWNGTIMHKKIQASQKRIIGTNRQCIGHEIDAKGLANYISEKFLHEKKQTDRKTNQVYRKIASEFRHRNQLASEIRIDAESAKKVFESRISKKDKNKISGFVHQISSNPFGVILMSEIQVFSKIRFFLF